MPHSRLILALLFIGSILIACGDSGAPQSENGATSVTSATQIKIGMSVQAVTDLLGDPNISQTRTIDDLTIVHNEWTDESGTLSVQFQNGKVQYSQYSATPAQN